MHTQSHAVTIQKKISGKHLSHDADQAVKFEENPNHQEEEGDIAEGSLVVAGEAA